MSYFDETCTNVYKNHINIQFLLTNIEIFLGYLHIISSFNSQQVILHMSTEIRLNAKQCQVSEMF